MNVYFLLGLALGCCVGVVAGVVWYRYQLKNHPEKLQQWLNELNAKIDEAKRNLTDAAK